MFSVTNSTWTLLAIVPSSTVCVCEFPMSVFFFNFACVCVRVYVQSSSTFYIDSRVCVCRLSVFLFNRVRACVGIRFRFVLPTPCPQHEAQNQSTGNKAAHGALKTHTCQLVGAPKKRRK